MTKLPYSSTSRWLASELNSQFSTKPLATFNRRQVPSAVLSALVSAMNHQFAHHLLTVEEIVALYPKLSHFKKPVLSKYLLTAVTDSTNQVAS